MAVLEVSDCEIEGANKKGCPSTAWVPLNQISSVELEYSSSNGYTLKLNTVELHTYYEVGRCSRTEDSEYDALVKLAQDIITLSDLYTQLEVIDRRILDTIIYTDEIENAINLVTAKLEEYSQTQAMLKAQVLANIYQP